MARPIQLLMALALASLMGCAFAPKVPTPAPLADWQALPLPGKAPTQYLWVQKDGQPAWHAVAVRSASLWRRQFHQPLPVPEEVEFSWWAAGFPPGADVRQAERDDAPVRVMFAFGGDTSRLSMRNRMLFELAQTLSGEAPPYATLMYVWDEKAPVEEVVLGHRTDRVRKLVVESGSRNLKQWRRYKRNLREDFRRAFGEDPGPLLSVAVMTDTDNTASRAEAWYGEIRLR